MATSSYGTLTANGDSSVLYLDGGGIVYFGGKGTFGSGTVSLYMSVDKGSNYILVPNSAFTAEGIYTAELPECQVKLTLSGSTSPSLYWALAKL